MEFDEIIIGSGLSATGLLLGMSDRKRILMIGGHKNNRVHSYNSTVPTPCLNEGIGGLGNFWHGVIPLKLDTLEKSYLEDFMTLFNIFYPKFKIQKHLLSNKLFVPYTPIRPLKFIKKELKKRRGQLIFKEEFVNLLKIENSTVIVHTDKSQFRSKRVWICAGALSTPEILSKTFNDQFYNQFAKDHFIVYVGNIKNESLPDSNFTAPNYNKSGILFNGLFDSEQSNSLLTIKPAKFAFKTLDYGIQQRMIFGLATKKLLSKLFSRFSPGLFFEALYNKTGLFHKSDLFNIYAQVLIDDAYFLNSNCQRLTKNEKGIQQRLHAFHDQLEFKGLNKTLLRDNYLPGIHLHNTISDTKIKEYNLDSPNSPIQIVDPSMSNNIGCEHHSFNTMVRAFSKAKNSG